MALEDRDWYKAAEKKFDKRLREDKEFRRMVEALAREYERDPEFRKAADDLTKELLKLLDE